MVAIDHITLANAYNDPFVAVIIQVEERDCGASEGCLSHNTEPGGVPDEVLRPRIAAWIEERGNLPSCWLPPLEAIATPLIAVAARQRQVIGVI